ncbi:MAG: hypothetical protein ACD_85C00012G0002 [uncultured bacterium]|nr:MAG: hypothetical protein ACD_85C00012G0002 [uncultured bacterium]
MQYNKMVARIVGANSTGVTICNFKVLCLVKAVWIFSGAVYERVRCT